MKQNLTRKQVIISFFRLPALLGKIGITGLIFFCQRTFFEVLGKGVARGHGPPSNKNVVSDF